MQNVAIAIDIKGRFVNKLNNGILFAFESAGASFFIKVNSSYEIFLSCSGYE